MTTWLSKETGQDKTASIKSFIGTQVDLLKAAIGELESIYDGTDGDKVPTGREHDFQFIQEQLKQVTQNLKRAADVAKTKATGQ